MGACNSSQGPAQAAHGLSQNCGRRLRLTRQQRRKQQPSSASNISSSSTDSSDRSDDSSTSSSPKQSQAQKSDTPNRIDANQVATGGVASAAFDVSDSQREEGSDLSKINRIGDRESQNRVNLHATSNEQAEAEAEAEEAKNRSEQENREKLQRLRGKLEIYPPMS